MTDAWSWRAVFYLNLPVGICALFLAYRFVPHDRPEGERPRFDPVGATGFAAGLAALLLALNQGHQWGWRSLPTLAVLGLAVVVLTAVFLFEGRTPSPILQLGLFRNRLFSVASSGACLNYIALYTCMFLMPFYLIQGRGLSPGRAGTILTAQPLLMAAMASISGFLSDRFGSRILGIAGMGLMSVGLFWLAFLSPTAPAPQVALRLALVGLGTGMFIAPNNSALMGSAPRSHQGIAAGIMATARNLGMVLGIGLAGAVFTTWQAHGSGIFPAVHAGLFAGACAALLGTLVTGIR